MAAAALSLDATFAVAMARLGPFEANPRMAVAVSGGADSMALALLARDWVCPRHGALQAFVVDHRLRSSSTQEAALTVARLRGLGIAASLLTLATLRPGSALAERARIMRYRTLFEACRSAGVLHLLVGHHAADQIETMMMRTLARTRTHGLAAIPALSEYAGVRLLRPLLRMPPETLRRMLRQRDVGWAEDPSNDDQTALRPRLRRRLGGQLSGDAWSELIESAAAIGTLRAQEETAIAEELARRTVIRPEGFALLSPGRISIGALAALIRTIGGAAYAAGTGQLSELARQPRAATIAGVRLLPAGRHGDGLLLVREEAAVAEPMAASPNATWDQRFRILTDHAQPAGTVIGKLGPDAARFRRQSGLPSVVMRTLPAIRFNERLEAVPQLGYVNDTALTRVATLFTPPQPLAGSVFVPA